MPSFIEDGVKVVIGGVFAAALLMALNWIDTPGKDDIRDMWEKEKPWQSDTMALANKIDNMERMYEALERADATQLLKMDAILAKQDNAQVKYENELRGIQNSLFRIMARLELMDEAKKKEEDLPHQ